ncbi:MAG: hypothetical protein M1828_005991 [Chrysothrix sp. TS-e1954]|nr:MAG: hypothetical protein M1828_005991 [Chrysothrix sp. TS-e1954]
MHHFIALSALLATTASVASAKSSSTTASQPVVTMWFPNEDPVQNLDASILSANPTQTVAVFQCASTSTSSKHQTKTKNLALPTAESASATCGIDAPITVTAGPSTFGGNYIDEGVTYLVDCKLSASTAATCTVGYANSDTTSTTVSILKPSEVSSGYQPITITGGADKLASLTSSASGSASGSTSGSASGSAATGAASRMGSYGRAGLAGVAAFAAAQVVV